MFIDSHCHLDRLKLDKYQGELDLAIEAALQNGVEKMLCVAIDLENIHKVLSIAGAYPSVYASVGVHPGSTDVEEPSLERLVELSKVHKVVAIGETGLDYYYGKDHRETQLERFKTHLMAAKQVGKPVIVHTRDAKEETLEYIANYADPESAGVLHCFTEDLDMAMRAIELNFYISFSGIVTFKNAVELQEVARHIPLDRLLIETDSPYLAPVPYRGKPNEPKYVPEVARFLAELRNIRIEELAEASSRNFHALFKEANA